MSIALTTKSYQTNGVFVYVYQRLQSTTFCWENGSGAQIYVKHKERGKSKETERGETENEEKMKRRIQKINSINVAIVFVVVTVGR